MYYRLRRIEELADVDLSDEETCFVLQLSLAMKKDALL
jgi:DNA-binding PucR family transcriptional regulator